MENKIPISNKEALLRLIKNYGKKGKLKYTKNPKLKIGGVDSREFIANFTKLNYKNSPSLHVRETLEKLAK